MNAMLSIRTSCGNACSLNTFIPLSPLLSSLHSHFMIHGVSITSLESVAWMDFLLQNARLTSWRLLKTIIRGQCRSCSRLAVKTRMEYGRPFASITAIFPMITTAVQATGSLPNQLSHLSTACSSGWKELTKLPAILTSVIGLETPHVLAKFHHVTPWPVIDDPLMMIPINSSILITI